MIPWYLLPIVCIGSASIASMLVFRLTRKTVNEAKKLATEAWTAYQAIDDELERTAWSLGGRLRDQDQPPIYTMPPGQESVKSCDEARVAWMECAHAASLVLRQHGFEAEADKIHGVTVKAKTLGLGQTKLDPKSITGSMG